MHQHVCATARRRAAHPGGAMLLAATILAVPAPGLAQTAEVAPTAGVEDIIVTGRLRSERLQDTPLSITAFSETRLENAVVENLTELQRFTPNVQFSDVQFSGNTLASSIRGVSFADLEKTFENAIGVSIDGVFLGSNAGAAVEMSDIQSVEILRGPQGTLQGRNTIGGAINIRRTNPTDEAGVQGVVRYRRYNVFDGSLIINTGRFADYFAFKAFLNYKAGNSHTFNTTLGRQEDGLDYLAGGGTLLWDTGGDWTGTVTLEAMRDRSNAPNPVNLTRPNLSDAQRQQIRLTFPPNVWFGVALGSGGNVCDAVLTQFFSDAACDTASLVPIRESGYSTAVGPIPFKNFMDLTALTSNITGQIGTVGVKSITGWRKSRELLIEENTGAPPIPIVNAPLFVAARDTSYTQISQEFNFNFDLTDRIDMVAGLYYLHTDYVLVPGTFNGVKAQAFLLGNPIQSFTAGQKLNAYAVFGEGIWSVTDRVRLTGGFRYSYEEKDFFINSVAPVPFAVQRQESWGKPTGRVIVDAKITPDIMVYGGWSRGFRAGGFNGRAASVIAAERSYDPETVDSIESGFRMSFLDDRLRVNPTGFYTKYRNVQQDIIVQAPGGAGTNTFVENAGGARIYGFELELNARPTERVNLYGALGLLNAKYTRFIIEDPANPGSFIDVKDQRQWRRAPDVTFSVGGDWTIPAGPGSIIFGGNLSYIDEYATSPLVDPFGREIIEAQTKLDLTLSYEREDLGPLKRFRLSAFGRDIAHGANGRLNTTLNAGLFFFGVQVPARIWGVEALVAF